MQFFCFNLIITLVKRMIRVFLTQCVVSSDPTQPRKNVEYRLILTGVRSEYAPLWRLHEHHVQTNHQVSKNILSPNWFCQRKIDCCHTVPYAYITFKSNIISHQNEKWLPIMSSSSPQATMRRRSALEPLSGGLVRNGTLGSDIHS